MQVLGDLKTHYWRVQRMARATGTNLVRAMEDGDLTEKDWAGIVEACRGCPWAEGCDSWLDRDMCVSEAPSGCLNKAHFARLKAAAG